MNIVNKDGTEQPQYKRQEKIKLLQALKQGVLNISDLNETTPAVCGCLVVFNGAGETYFMNGRNVSHEEFEKYQESFESSNKVSKIIGRPLMDPMIIKWEEILSR